MWFRIRVLQVQGFTVLLMSGGISDLRSHSWLHPQFFSFSLLKNPLSLAFPPNPCYTLILPPGGPSGCSLHTFYARPTHTMLGGSRARSSL